MKLDPPTFVWRVLSLGTMSFVLGHTVIPFRKAPSHDAHGVEHGPYIVA